LLKSTLGGGVTAAVSASSVMGGDAIWASIQGELPARHVEVWRRSADHVIRNLILSGFAHCKDNSRELLLDPGFKSPAQKLIRVPALDGTTKGREDTT